MLSGSWQWLVHSLCLKIVEVEQGLLNFNVSGLTATSHPSSLSLLWAQPIVNLHWLLSVTLAEGAGSGCWSLVALARAMVGALRRPDELRLFGWLAQWHRLSVSIRFRLRFRSWSQACRIEQAFQHYEIILIAPKYLRQVFCFQHVRWTRWSKLRRFVLLPRWCSFVHVRRYNLTRDIVWFSQSHHLLVMCIIDVVDIVDFHILRITIESIWYISLPIFLLRVWFRAHCEVSRNLL